MILMTDMSNWLQNWKLHYKHHADREAAKSNPIAMRYHLRLPRREALIIDERAVGAPKSCTLTRLGCAAVSSWAWRAEVAP